MVELEQMAMAYEHPFALLYPGLPEGGLDNPILFLVVLVVLILLLPWERISSLKAVGVEIALDQAKLHRAIETVKGQGKSITDKNLRNLRGVAPFQCKSCNRLFCTRCVKGRGPVRKCPGCGGKAILKRSV